MYYLSGAEKIELRAVSKAGAPIGLMLQFFSNRKAWAVRHYTRYAVDNGCFARPDKFVLSNYLRWLDGLPSKERSFFATAPDVLGDAAATWRLSRDTLGQVRETGHPAALVAQDGFDPRDVDWSLFDALFIGGTTEWKWAESGGFAAIAEGKRRGKHVHVGRVNTEAKLHAMAVSGADSADGTCFAYGYDRNIDRILRPLQLNGRQGSLNLFTGGNNTHDNGPQ